MTSPPETITVRCGGCGGTFRDWVRPSVNLDLDPWAGACAGLSRADDGTRTHDLLHGKQTL